jgi:hypothetical protein
MQEMQVPRVIAIATRLEISGHVKELGQSTDRTELNLQAEMLEH